jgi:hypothetical protein
MLKSLQILVIFLYFAPQLAAQTITNFPYEEKFTNLVPAAGQQIPTGWTAQNLNNDPAIWDVLPNSASYPGNAHSAPNALHMSFNPSADADDWLFTPPIQMQAGATYTLHFWYKAVDIGFGTVEKMKIHVGNTPDVAAVDQVSIWDNPEIINTDYVLDSIQYVPTESGNYHFAFCAYSEPFQFLLALDDVSITAIGLSPVTTIEEASAFSVFPNPTSDFLNVNSKVDGQLVLYDFAGKKVLVADLKIGDTLLNIGHLADGVYTIKINKSDKVTFSTQIVVKH